MFDDERQRFSHPDVELGPIVAAVVMDDSPPPLPPPPPSPSDPGPLRSTPKKKPKRR